MAGEKFNLTAEVDVTSGRKNQDRGNRVDLGLVRLVASMFQGEFGTSSAHVNSKSCKKKETC